jgi:alpha-beta hydrolase superfamily lysophospholipase
MGSTDAAVGGTTSRIAIRRSESSFQGLGGLRLFRRSWLPATSERVLVVVHGFAEHSGRYDHMGQWFSSRGFAVHAYDQRGHGRSQGRRGHVERFDEYLDDLQLLLERVRDEHPGQPLVLCGHSMGGLVVASFLGQRKLPGLQAAVTSCAALALSPDLPRWRVWTARLLRSIAPRLHLSSGLDPEGLSRDPSVVRAYLEDPLVDRRMTMALGSELLQAVSRAEDWAQRVPVPMLLLHGEADPICPVRGSRDFHARVRAAGSQLRTYPGLRHEIFNEPEHEEVFQDVLEWVRGLPEAVG